MAPATRRDPETVRGVILDWLRARLPQADDIDITGLTVPASGSSSETLLLDLAIAERGRTRREQWVLRIQATDFQVYQNPAVERQYRVLDVLSRETNVPVPGVLWYEPDPAVLGAPFFLMKRVAGATPPEMFHSSGILADATPAAREAMWLSAIEAMSRIHRVDPALVAFLNRPALGATGLDQEIAAWDDYAGWAKVPSHPTLERGRRWLADHIPKVRQTGLAWGDARLGNVIFRDDRCAAILDWETVSLGGAETDLGWWLYYEHSITHGAGVAPLDGIGDRAATIAAWEGFVGRKAEAMQWHEAFATWRFANIVERAVALTVAAGGTLPVSSGDGNPAVVRLRELIA